MNLTYYHKFNDYQIMMVINERSLILTDKRREKAHKRFKEDVIYSLLLIMLVTLVSIFFIHKASEPKGYYAADLMENGILYDTDGDGDYYHWVDPEE